MDELRRLANLLIQRLPETIRLAKERDCQVYQRRGEIPDDAPVIQDFTNFVELCEEKERDRRAGKDYRELLNCSGRRGR